MSRFIEDGEKVIANIEVRHEKGSEGSVYEISMNGQYLGSCWRKPHNTRANLYLAGNQYEMLQSMGRKIPTAPSIKEALLLILKANLDTVIDDHDI